MTTNGAPLSGVNIMIEGTKAASTTTDANGNYTLIGLPRGGNYTITPAKAKVDFMPRSRSLNNLTQDGWADFSGLVQPNAYKISGRVTNNGAPLSGVNVMIEGPIASTTSTDANGNYTFSNVPKGGNYTITPARAKIDFTPRSRSFKNLTQDGWADFSGLAQSNLYKISGRVTDEASAKPLSGVDILLKGTRTASTTTDANGGYTFNSLPEGGNYTIAAAKANIDFTPRSRSLNNLTQDGWADFSGLAQPNLYKISGRVTEEATAKPLSGVNILLKGAKSASTTTDANGNFSFGSLPEGGRYTITPDRAKMNFRPRDRSIRSLTKDESVDFSLAAPECSEADQDREDQIIRSYFPASRRNIQGERTRIIAENVPDGAVEIEAILGEIDFQVTFLIPCRSAAITARYVWQVSYALPAPHRQTKTVPRRRTIGCGKVFGKWDCR